jgi:nucleotide-binding universal stress UspA family protein
MINQQSGQVSSKSISPDVTQHHPGGPIFWALDPDLENEELNQRAGKLAQIFASALDLKVQPLTVVPLESEDWTPIRHKVWEPRLNECISKIDGLSPRLLEPLFTLQATNSIRHLVDTFTHKALAGSARMIVASTHARHGFSRLALGSFCETLASTSSFPVALVNSHTEVPASIESVIFPTDFSDASKERLFESLQLVRSLGATLKLFHKLMVPFPTLVEPGYMLAGVDLGTVEAVFESERQTQERTAQIWKSEIQMQGIECEAIFSTSSGSILDGILDLASNTASSLIMIPDQTGPLASVLLGHLSRGLARECKRPVLILPLRG